MQKTLYLALELSANTWKLGFAADDKPRPKIIDVAARDWTLFDKAVEKAREHFGFDDPKVVSCYEAGRDGFWIHRGLLDRGIANQVIDSASIEVSRRKRIAKTDGLDVRSLLRLLQRHHRLEETCFRIVEVPKVTDEDERHLHRELEALKGERTMLSNRVKSLLIAHGIVCSNLIGLATLIPSLRDANGNLLPPGLQRRLTATLVRFDLVHQQIKELESLQDRLVKQAADPKTKQVKQLTLLRGIGNRSSWILIHEVFGWRHFHNRKQVGAFPGLVPTPFSSGTLSREQGISKAGNARIRWLMVEISWFWLRWQPDSKLTKWFHARSKSGGRRIRRISIVALARKLFIALWRFLQHGVVPEGATLSMI